MDDLNSENFDAEKFLQQHWSPNDDLRKLQAFRGNIQGIADETAQVIKKNVFQNYSQFIDTSNEISFLEREMYQLNHLLTEQKNLIDRMMNISFTGTRENKGGDRLKSVDDRRKSIQHLLDKVEGCSHLAENSQRYVVFDSDLTELNPDNYAPIRQVHGFLLDDGLMMTSWIPQRLGAMRYKYEAMYQLENLAVKNVEDSVGVKNAFTLTVFPEHRIYQCENQKLKRKWLDAIDLVKRQMLREGSLMRQATIRMKREKEAQVAHDHGQFGNEDRVNSNEAEYEGEWLRELPDELDVCIAQRDFEGAVDLIFEAKDYLQEATGSMLVQEAKEKITQRETQLVDLLSMELRSSGEQALQGGPKAARRAISLLVRLGKSSKACDLYLKNRSLTIKQALRELKIVDVTVTFVTQLTRVVFTHLIDAGKDFTKLFADNPGCLSVLLLWASGELKNYVNQLLRHVFDPGPTLSVIGQCVKLARNHVVQLSEIGLDLEFEFEKLLSPHIRKVIEQNRENFMEALRRRIAEDKWKPNNLQSESALAKYVEEMKELGVNLEPYVFEQSTFKPAVKDRCFLWLTAQTCHFVRAVMRFMRDLALLRAGDQQELTDSALISVWRLQLAYLNNSEMSAPHNMVQKNAEFLRNYLLPLCESRYIEGAKIKGWCKLSNLLVTEFSHVPGELEVVGDV